MASAAPEAVELERAAAPPPFEGKEELPKKLEAEEAEQEEREVAAPEEEAEASDEEATEDNDGDDAPEEKESEEEEVNPNPFNEEEEVNPVGFCGSSNCRRREEELHVAVLASNGGVSRSYAELDKESEGARRRPLQRPLGFLEELQPEANLQILLKQSPLPTLVTYRPKWEGGQYEGDDSRRLDTLRLAMESGADYVDVELQVAHEFFSSIHGKKPEKVKIHSFVSQL